MVRPGRLPANAMPEMSFPIGAATLAEIYGSGADDFPLDPDEWEARAKAVLAPGPFDYIAGGAGGESTMRANRDAFARWRLRPAMLAGNQQRDLRVSLLGTASPAPFLLAPVGVLSAAHAESDLAVARAAAAAGVPLVVSTAASTSMERTAEAMGAAPRWYQLYWANDREVVASFVQRAEAAGCAAIVLTLDTLQLGWRPRDLRTRYLPFILGEGIAQFTSDPVFRSRLSVSPEDDPRGAGACAGRTSRGCENGGDSRCWPRASCAPRTRVGSSTPAFKASLFPTTAAARWMGPSPRSMRWWRCATR